MNKSLKDQRQQPGGESGVASPNSVCVAAGSFLGELPRTAGSLESAIVYISTGTSLGRATPRPQCLPEEGTIIQRKKGAFLQGNLNLC